MHRGYVLVAAALLSVSRAAAATINSTPNPIAFGGVTIGSTDTIEATATFTPDAGFTLLTWVLGSTSAPFSNSILSSPTGNCVSTPTCIVDVSFSPTTTGLFTGAVAFTALETNGLGGFNAATDAIPISGMGVPLPAALPLFGTGLGALGLLGWRKKRKARVSLLGADFYF